MLIKKYYATFVFICLLFSISLNSIAAQPGSLTAGSYFGLGSVQQKIHLEQFMKANESIVDECVPGMTVDDFQKYFNNWLKENPGIFSRTLQLAFTSAVVEKCVKK